MTVIDPDAVDSDRVAEARAQAPRISDNSPAPLLDRCRPVFAALTYTCAGHEPGTLVATGG